VIDVQRVDFIRVPVTDMEKAKHFSLADAFAAYRRSPRLVT
jgi:hypothetical protein